MRNIFTKFNYTRTLNLSRLVR